LKLFRSSSNAFYTIAGGRQRLVANHQCGYRKADFTSKAIASKAIVFFSEIFCICMPILYIMGGYNDKSR